jgi:hypothetical protein
MPAEVPVMLNVADSLARSICTDLVIHIDSEYYLLLELPFRTHLWSDP